MTRFQGRTGLLPRPRRPVGTLHFFELRLITLPDGSGDPSYVMTRFQGRTGLLPRPRRPVGTLHFFELRLITLPDGAGYPSYVMTRFQVGRVS